MEKSIYNFIAVFPDGETVDMDREGLWVESFRIQSPQGERDRVKIPGRPGLQTKSADINERVIPVRFEVEAVDYIEYDRLRDRIHELFNPKRPFYVIRDLQPEKRILVEVDGGYELDYNTLEEGYLSLNLIAPLPYFESVEVVSRSFRTPEFSFRNSGNVLIDPRETEETEIVFNGDSDNLKITNKTTGDVWSYSGTSYSGQEIMLKGVRSLKAGLSIYRDTNKRLITFSTGSNDMLVEGASGDFEITVRTRMFYE